MHTIHGESCCRAHIYCDTCTLYMGKVAVGHAFTGIVHTVVVILAVQAAADCQATQDVIAAYKNNDHKTVLMI